MSHNTFGHLFRVTTWGESHGPALGCVIDGAPPRIPVKAEDIQHWLDRRRPGTSRFTTQRREPDAVKILSGTFVEDGIELTTGTPISLMIENVDQRSKDYGDIVEKFRPGHADFTYFSKYGIRDHRGGGRSSARETAARVAAAGIARAMLPGVSIRGALVQMGPHKIDRANWDWEETENNPFWCPDKTAAAKWETYLDGVRIDDFAGAGDLVDPGLAQQAVINVFKPIQFFAFGRHQFWPMVLAGTDIPAEACRVFEVFGEMGTVHEELFRHAAAHHAGAADAHVFDHGGFLAVALRGKPRCPDAAGPAADGDHVVIVVSHFSLLVLGLA